MKKRAISLFLCIFIITSCASCKAALKYDKYQAEFMGLFNTYAIILGYAKTQKDFDIYSEIIYNRLVELDKKFTIYDDYDGVVNIKTINDMAGIAPVKVDKDILDLLILSKQAYDITNGAVNIAMGSVLKVWHDYRTNGNLNPDLAELPPMDMLENASEFTDINDLIIDEEAGTVFLTDSKMSIDVGATAKGFAAYLAVEDAMKAGMESALANIGGNIISVGKPIDGVRQRWGVGIQDPNKEIQGTSNLIDTIYVNNKAVVCSGNYEKYYTVAGEKYNHIIDPGTLMPVNKYKSVTVVIDNAKYADILSTALFIMDIEEGTKLAEQYNTEVLWILHDDSMKATDGYKTISKNMGGYSAIDK